MYCYGNICTMTRAGPMSIMSVNGSVMINAADTARVLLTFIHIVLGRTTMRTLCTRCTRLRRVVPSPRMLHTSGQNDESRKIRVSSTCKMELNSRIFWQSSKTPLRRTIYHQGRQVQLTRTIILLPDLLLIPFNHQVRMPLRRRSNGEIQRLTEPS